MVPRAIWRGDDYALRCGRSGDVVTMLDDLNIPSIGSIPPQWMITTGRIK